jgi:hypothetical protein
MGILFHTPGRGKWIIKIAKIRKSAYLQNTKLSNIVTKGKTPELYIFFMQKGKSAQNMILDIQNDDKYD